MQYHDSHLQKRSASIQISHQEVDTKKHWTKQQVGQNSMRTNQIF